ncbi:methyltransferase domain-containing protein [Motilibacter deserti]|uniref:Methyltransferase domain-containing protein n=1 Tax=Motilibacter deserti TaxID=2714956 RepID=A0ABX0GXH4_9ACTN|nr:methyltransferase domain-containing protein [Motilibacter deserti]NHC15687.1 methyltransferase domain-containing protein [Motilibacter deserti]
MTMTDIPVQPVPADLAPDPREVLGQRLLEALLGALELGAVHLGRELGLYTALRHAPATPSELAERAGIDERYAREWLEQQAACAVLELAPPSADASARSYSLSPAHAEVLTEGDSPYFAAGIAQVAAGVASVMPLLPKAYREGTGIAYSAFGPHLRAGIAALNRPMFVNELASTWIPAVPELHDQLTSGAEVTVLDLGCGSGASSIAIARGFENARVIGLDLDPTSVAEAQAAATAAGLSERVRFLLADSAEASAHLGPGSVDVVTVFEALHDMGDPVGALRSARDLLKPGGGILVADEGAAEEFEAPAGVIDRFNYGFSVLHCLPATRAEDAKEANGTVLRPGTMRRWAHEAGFSRCAVVDIAHPFWRFYHLEG